MARRLMVIPLSPIKESTLVRLRKSIERACRVQGPHSVAGAVIDAPQLSGEEQNRFDEGEAPKGWVEWWQNKATYVQNLEGSALITLEPGPLGYRHVQPIDLKLLRDLMETVIWTREGGVILAWGVPDTAMNQKHLRRITCSGALGVQADGCGAVLLCDPSTTAEWTW